MAFVFFYAEGISSIDYLEMGKTINIEYYCYLLDQLNEKNGKETWFFIKIMDSLMKMF